MNRVFLILVALLVAFVASKAANAAGAGCEGTQLNDPGDPNFHFLRCVNKGCTTACAPVASGQKTECPCPDAGSSQCNGFYDYSFGGIDRFRCPDIGCPAMEECEIGDWTPTDPPEYNPGFPGDPNHQLSSRVCICTGD